jgi:hypothetical protein
MLIEHMDDEGLAVSLPGMTIGNKVIAEMAEPRWSITFRILRRKG